MSLPDERELIAELTAWLSSRRNRAGFDSDCAIVPSGETDLVASVDGFAASTHFPEGLRPEQAGRLAAGAALADLAAAGAEVIGVLAAYGVPSDGESSRLRALSEGIASRVEQAGGEVLGGDTKPRSELTLTLTALGSCPSGEAMVRTRARPGEQLIVTGPLGGAGAALDRIREGLPAAEADPLVPPLRVEAGQALREAGVACAMDLSDGLADAAVAIAEAAEVEVRVDADQIPLHEWAGGTADGLDHALTTGGDYELAATVEPGSLPAVLDELESLGLQPAQVGEIAEGQGALLRHEDGENELQRGYEHAFHDGPG